MEGSLRGIVEEKSLSCENAFCVGGVSVGLTGSRGKDVALVPSLEPFRVESAGIDISLDVGWVSNLPHYRDTPLFDSGATWAVYRADNGFRFDFQSPVFGGRVYKRLRVDECFSQAQLQMSEACYATFPLEATPLEYPLDELLIMHRLTQERAIELHGVGIVGPEGAANLFVGHSGAGKSTTARLWTGLRDVKILSDDRIIVREHVREHIREHVRENVGENVDATQMFMYGTPWHGEAHFALAQRAPLQRIFILEHGRGNLLTRLTRSQMVAELFARAFVPFHRHDYVETALSVLERLADSVPGYRYSFEPDERAVQRILQLND
jgi:hypothetical protein